jgi:hypothetical protein
MAGRPFTDEERNTIAAMHAMGATRNAIGKHLGRSGSAIGYQAQLLGITWDAKPVAEATAVIQINNKARRAELAAKLLLDAERLRQQLFSPTTLHSFGGKDHTYESRDIDQPLFKDQKDLVTAINVAAVTSMKLELHDGESDADNVSSLLGSLFDNMVKVNSERVDRVKPTKGPRQQALEAEPITYADTE